MIPNACVVEVIERVPDADVAIVAARVGERLGMPPERVRQLIDGRTGPITRALRPEKADAIAQTFEAAGVRVVIRAADPDEIEEARAGTAAARAPEVQSAPVPEPEAEPEATLAPEVGEELDPESALSLDEMHESDAAVGADPQPEPHFEPVPEFDPVPEFEPVREFEPEDEVDPEPAPALEAEPEPEFEPAPEVEAEWVSEEPDAEPASAPEMDWSDGDLVPDADAPSEQGLAREVAYIFSTGESPAWRGPVDGLETPVPDRDDAATGATPSAAGGPGGVLDVDDAGIEEIAGDTGREAQGDVANTKDGFSPVGGWDADGAGAWSTRRDAARREGTGAAGTPDRRPPVPEFAIGRASRRPRDDEAPRPPEVDLEPAPDQIFADPPVPAVPRPVPTAWRGLGGADAGPARPPSARLPRREEPVVEPRFVFDEPPVRRRTLMLAALGVSVVLFVLAQWWVASRAGAAGVDPFDAYRRGEFVAARTAWDAEAAAGDPSARFMLGYLAEAGLGAPWSARTAAGWYTAAADGGHVEAMWRLARLYEVGLGVAPDTLEARRWYRAAALAGHAEAAFAWGRTVLHDAGVALGAGTAPQVAPATAAEAAAAFELATELGWHEAAPYAAAFAAVGVEVP